jgi:UDP-glucose 4-epimerase
MRGLLPTDLRRRVEAIRETRRAHALFVESTRLVLRLAERHPTIRRVVLVRSASVYRLDPDEPDLIREDQALLSRGAAPWLRERVEADLLDCARMGMSPVRIAVLRCAEILAPGSQLWDYLKSRVCLRPMGFDPMLNVLSIEDAVLAILRALRRGAEGVFNIPGKETLPLSEAIRRAGRRDLPVPGFLLGPLYACARRSSAPTSSTRSTTAGSTTAIVDGHRAHEALGTLPGAGSTGRASPSTVRKGTSGGVGGSRVAAVTFANIPVRTHGRGRGCHLILPLPAPSGRLRPGAAHHRARCSDRLFHRPVPWTLFGVRGDARSRVFPASRCLCRRLPANGCASTSARDPRRRRACVAAHLLAQKSGPAPRLAG